jgi:hypothetical protein
LPCWRWRGPQWRYRTAKAISSRQSMTPLSTPSGWDEVVKRIVETTNSVSGNLVLHQADAGSLTALYYVDPALAEAYAQTYPSDGQSLAGPKLPVASPRLCRPCRCRGGTVPVCTNADPGASPARKGRLPSPAFFHDTSAADISGGNLSLVQWLPRPKPSPLASGRKPEVPLRASRERPSTSKAASLNCERSRPK